MLTLNHRPVWDRLCPCVASYAQLLDGIACKGEALCTLLLQHCVSRPRWRLARVEPAAKTLQGSGLHLEACPMKEGGRWIGTLQRGCFGPFPREGTCTQAEDLE